METVDLRKGLNMNARFLLAVPISRNKVRVYYQEDAAEIVGFLAAMGCKEQELLLIEFWKREDTECCKRWKMRAVRDQRRRKRSRYKFDFNLKKSIRCTGECPPGRTCHRVAIPSSLQGGGSFTCRCLALD